MASSLVRSLLAATAASSLFLVATAASADVSPPDDQKSVGYSFAVHGITSVDRVVFAFPCGTSDGAPKDELRVLENDKAITVGRRGGVCTLYSIEKTKYDDFAKTFTPKEGSGSDPKLAAFAATATKCSGAPNPVFVIPKTDARSSIKEDLDVKTLDASTCKVETRATTPTTNPTNPTDPNANPSATDNGSSVPSASDDGGCSVGGSAKGAAPWLVALAVPFFLLGRRRKNDKKA